MAGAEIINRDFIPFGAQPLKQFCHFGVAQHIPLGDLQHDAEMVLRE